MSTQRYSKETYFMDDPREGTRLEKKANAEKFVDKYLKSFLDSLWNGVILEAGCGSGAFLKEVGKRYPKLSIAGVDISEDRVLQANTKISNLENSTAVVANIYDLPFPDNYFDFIYSRFLFEYLSEPIAATKELYRVCKPGGKLLLQDLDGQFSFYPEQIVELKDILLKLKEQTGFDPNVGRKLFSFGKVSGFNFLHAESELYHKIFGEIDDLNYDLWEVKLDIACNYIQKMITKEEARKIKKDILNELRDENTVIFSHLFTVVFEKRG